MMANLNLYKAAQNQRPDAQDEPKIVLFSFRVLFLNMPFHLSPIK
jgi:hypothetical protein